MSKNIKEFKEQKINQLKNVKIDKEVIEQINSIELNAVKHIITIDRFIYGHKIA